MWQSRGYWGLVGVGLRGMVGRVWDLGVRGWGFRLCRESGDPRGRRM